MASKDLTAKLLRNESGVVQQGAKVLEANPEPFPEERKTNDIIFAVLFLVVAALLVCIAYIETGGFTFSGKQFPPGAAKPMFCMVMAATCSFGAAFFFAFAYVYITEKRTKMVLYTSLFFGPIILVLLGVATPIFVESNSALMCSACLMLMGVLQMVCVLCCWRRYIPFTLDILQHVAAVLEGHPVLFYVAMGASFKSLIWCILCGMASSGVFERMQQANDACNEQKSQGQNDSDEQKSQGQNDSDECSVGMTFYLIYFGVATIFFWGTILFQNIAHVTNIGVFGRWFFGKDVSVGKSLKVALTTSFGSICLGSLIIAVISAVETTLTVLRKQAEKEGNIPLKIIACALECIVSCVKEIAKAFTYVAFVQVGVRGLSFVDSAKATWALCTEGNVFKIISVTLIGNVIFLGSFVVACLSGLVGFFVGQAFHSEGPEHARNQTVDMANGVVGVLLGFWVANTVLGILRSGFATIVVCFAEAETLLKSNHETLHDTLHAKRTEFENDTEQK